MHFANILPVSKCIKYFVQLNWESMFNSEILLFIETFFIKCYRTGSSVPIKTK